MGGPAIDLNSDVGEGFGVYRLGDDQALLGVVSSANVACGFHAGDPSVMAATVRAAARRGVAVGAHVSYPDRVGFGRRPMVVEPDQLACDVAYQLGALDALARLAGTRVTYVKPHGALYHRVAGSAEAASALVEAMVGYDPSLVLLGPPGSLALAVAAGRGVPVATEAFVDRAYLPDGSLVPRGQAGAVIADVGAAVERALRLAIEHTVVCVDGASVELEAQSLCLHGDTPGAAAMAVAVRDALSEAGVAIRSFAWVGPVAGSGP